MRSRSALAVFFTPALEELIGRWRRASRPPGRVFGAMRAAFLAELRPFIRVPALALAAAAACFIAAFVLYRAVGTDYLPALDEGAFMLDYITPPPSTLDDTDALLAKIEDILRATPEVAAFSRRTGTQLGFFLTESNRGDFSVRLKQQRSRSIDEIMDDVRRRILAAVPGVHIEFSQVLQDLIGDLSGVPRADRGQGVRRRPGLDRGDRAPRRRRDRHGPGSRRRLRRPRGEQSRGTDRDQPERRRTLRADRRRHPRHARNRDRGHRRDRNSASAIG